MTQQYSHAPDGSVMATGCGNPVTGNAIQQLDRVKKALARLGIKFFELNWDVFGAGVGIARDGEGFIVLSVSGPADGVLNITVGILKNVAHERLRLLELCNSLTRDNTAFPVYLHDAPDGWDVHVQQRYLIDLLEDEPWFFRACVENLPATAESTRVKFQEAGIAGEPYIWNKSDAQRLLVRSLV
jgi:hypothetical protein